MIGTTRRVNPDAGTIDWVRTPSQGLKVPPPDTKENVIYRVHPEREGRKLIFQIGTSDPDRAVAAARLFAADVAGIDVNAGCPKPFSTHDGMGAALLKTPDKLCAILEALVAHIAPEFEIGISVKIRLLETREQTEALVRRLCATGITGLTIHCRTAPMRPREPAIRGQLRMIADVCREAGVACLMNGDVDDRDQAMKLVEEFGVDGAMIARGAETNPTCFRGLADGGPLEWRPMIEEYIKTSIQVQNRLGNTKYLLQQMIPGKEKIFKQIHPCKSYLAMCKVLGYEHLFEMAQETDVKLDIDDGGQLLSKQERLARRQSNATALAASGDMAATRKATHKSQNSASGRGLIMTPEAATASTALSA